MTSTEALADLVVREHNARLADAQRRGNMEAFSGVLRFSSILSRGFVRWEPPERVRQAQLDPLSLCIPLRRSPLTMEEALELVRVSDQRAADFKAAHVKQFPRIQ